MDQALLIYTIFVAILIIIFIIGAISEQRYINKKNKAFKDLLIIVLDYYKARNELKRYKK